PGLVQVGTLAGGAAPAVAAVLPVHADEQLPVPAAGLGLDAAAAGVAAHVGGHGHGHGAVRVGPAQMVVVHQVVHAVVVGAGAQRVPDPGQAAMLQLQRAAVAAEHGPVHAAAGVARPAVAGADVQLHEGRGVRGPGQGQVGVPLVPGRGHAAAVAVAVVVGARAGG